MKNKLIKKTEGWQMIVEIYNDYVIKHPKNKEQMRKKIQEHLASKKKLHLLDERIDKIQSDIYNSIKIIKGSSIPRKYLSNLKFLKESKIKQTKIRVLEEIFNSFKDQKKIEEIIDKYIECVVLLWKYKIHENTYKIYSNFGLMDSEIVLMDPFEITNKKEKVLSQIQRKKWAKPKKYAGKINKKAINYLIKKANETWTEKRLNEVWGKV